MFGLTLGNKHTFRDFGLVMTKYYIPEPKPKTERIDIPYASGSIDLTDILGVTNYEDREGLQFEFVINDHDYTHWDSMMQELAEHIHGRKLTMVPDSDKGYYYVVRLEVDGNKTYKHWGIVTLKGWAEPYKYAVQSLNEPWKWDTLNFNNGLATDLTPITINQSGHVVIPKYGIDTVPKFTVTNSERLAMAYKGNVFELYENKTYRFPQIKFGSEPVDLWFSGSGTISIEYKGRFL